MKNVLWELGRSSLLMLEILSVLGHAFCFQDLERKYGANSKEFHGALYLLERTIPKVSYPW